MEDHPTIQSPFLDILCFELTHLYELNDHTRILHTYEQEADVTYRTHLSQFNTGMPTKPPQHNGIDIAIDQPTIAVNVSKGPPFFPTQEVYGKRIEWTKYQKEKYDLGKPLELRITDKHHQFLIRPNGHVELVGLQEFTAFNHEGITNLQDPEKLK